MPATRSLVLSFSCCLLSALVPGSSVGAADAPKSADPKPAEAKPEAAKPADPAAKVDPLDWPMWRGPEGNGISRETGLVDSLDCAKGNPNVVWSRPDLGSRSTPIVMNGKLYVLCRAEPGTHKEGERVVCVDAATGKDVWENRFNVWSSTVPDTRVAWSSVVGDPQTGRVYAMGVCDYFQCLDGATGKTLWSVPLNERFGMINTYGGRTNFPVICDDLVIISGVIVGWGDQGRPAHRFIAFDKMTGDVVWFSGTKPLPEDTTYSTPNVCVLGGQKAMVFGSGDGGLWALQPRTGRVIWEFPLSRRGMDVTPVVVGDTVYYTQSEENLTVNEQGCAIAVNGLGKGNISKSNTIWREDGVTAGKSSPIVVGDRLYLVEDNAKLSVYDTKTGKAIGRKQTLGTAMRASLLYADGKIYAVESNGRWFVYTPDEAAGVKTLAKGRLKAEDEVHATPIVSHGRLYLNTTGGMYCLADASKKPAATPAPAAAVETPASADEKPTHAQVVPCELLLKPGQSQKLKVRLFNSAGQFLKESPAEFSLEGAGKVSAEGEYTADEKAGHTSAVVKAKVGELSGVARIRIVPPLPWSFDFEDVKIDPDRKTGEPPVTWVGARYRHVVRDVGGNKMMVKVTTIPKGTRSRASFGPDDLADYTISADVQSGIKDKKMSDIGITNQGYTLVLLGQHQQLQVFSWDAQLEQRVAKTIAFPWKPDTLYQMKLKVSHEKGKSVVQGKAWPGSEKEPQDWSVEISDEAPNLHGAPGLYADSTNAEILLDNIKVFANEGK